MTDRSIKNMPRTKIQFEEIRKEKKQLIMDTALELFAQNGYDTTSIKQIAKKAGISKGLMYNYFQSKEELVETILNKGIDDMLEILDPNNDGEIDPEELEFFINETLRILKENRVFWRLYYSISVQTSVFKLIENRIDELYKPIMTKMLTYFEKAGFENPLNECIIFSSLMDGISFNYVFKPDLIPIDAIKKEIINKYCRKNNKL